MSFDHQRIALAHALLDLGVSAALNGEGAALLVGNEPVGITAAACASILGISYRFDLDKGTSPAIIQKTENVTNKTFPAFLDRLHNLEPGSVLIARVAEEDRAEIASTLRVGFLITTTF